MTKKRIEELKADMPVSMLQDYFNGVRTAESTLVRFFGRIHVGLYADSVWTAIEKILEIFKNADPNKEWGRIHWGEHPWEAIEVKDKWEFLEKYITPIIEQGRPLISQYDEITQKTFQKCEQALLDLKKQREEQAKQLAETTTPIREHGANQHSDKDNKGGNYNNVQIRGLDPQYLAARIARDRPDIQEAMKEGKYKSVRAAAVDAGIVKPRMQFTVGESTTPQAFAASLYEKLKPDFLAELVAALTDVLTTSEPEDSDHE